MNLFHFAQLNIVFFMWDMTIFLCLTGCGIRPLKEYPGTMQPFSWPFFSLAQFRQGRSRVCQNFSKDGQARRGRQKLKSPRPEMWGWEEEGGLGEGYLRQMQRLGLTGSWEVQAQCPWRWHSLVSNFGNGHTRVSKLAGRLAAKGSEQQREPSGGTWPLSVMEGYDAELATARQQGLVSTGSKRQKGSKD